MMLSFDIYSLLRSCWCVLKHEMQVAKPYEVGDEDNDDHNHNANYTNPAYGLSLVDTLWNAGSYRQPLEQEGNPMT